MLSFTAGIGFARRCLRRLPACRFGATAVEFALVVPIFLSMMLGLMEMSRALWIKSTMQYAVDETTRFYMVNNSASTSTLETFAQTSMTSAGGNATGVTFSAAQGTLGTIDVMTVTATFNFTAIVPLPFPDVTLTVKSSVPLNS